MKKYFVEDSIFIRTQYAAFLHRNNEKRKCLYNIIREIEIIDNDNYSDQYKSMLDVLSKKSYNKYYIDNPVYVRIDLYLEYLKNYPYVSKHISI